ncbi:MAG TPA: M20/M25/M40 family metallo-hydrolase [Lentimicrobium sp.]|nr:M20/M25/M40 family metallo-hydrolase [Lentimicrobium sp.]
MKNSILLFLVLMQTSLFALNTVSENETAVQGEPDSSIVAAIALIDNDSLYSYVYDLQNMGTRFMIAPNRRDVATWIMNKFLSFGITEVRLDSFPAHITYMYDTTTWQYNVEARIQGSDFPDKEMVMIGHYDDVTQNSEPISGAPGADDNASGTAAILECARILNQPEYQPRQTMVFLASAAEELMYYGDSGTEHYAAEAHDAGRDIVMAINNDMIGWDDGTWTVQLFNHIGSPEITALAIDIITNYTTLNYLSSTPVHDVGGDIQPFIDAGYHSIYFMENSINPNYHTRGDSIDYLNFNYMAEITAIGLGCVLQTDNTVNSKKYPNHLLNLKILPNPATNNVTIYNPDNKLTHSLKIYKLDGTQQISQTISGSTANIDISILPPGTYLVVVSSETESYYSRLVVAPYK